MEEPINGRNQSPRHAQGGEGVVGDGRSSLQDAAMMAAAINNNKGIYLYYFD